MKCPQCGGECDRDEVDIGVGVQGGPWGCPDCHWTEAVEFPPAALPAAPEPRQEPAYLGGALSDVPRWLVVRKRDDSPCEVYPFQDEADARQFFDRAQEQWTCTYLCRVEEAPGFRPAAAPEPHPPLRETIRMAMKRLRDRVETIRAEAVNPAKSRGFDIGWQLGRLRDDLENSAMALMKEATSLAAAPDLGARLEELETQLSALGKDYGVLLGESNQWEAKAHELEAKLADLGALSARLRDAGTSTRLGGYSPGHLRDVCMQVAADLDAVRASMSPKDE